MPSPSFIDYLSNRLAEKIWERIQNKKIMSGERIIVTDYSESVLLKSADILANLSEKDPSRILKENIVFIVPENEAPYLRKRQGQHQSHLSCSSYCVTIRDSGKTAIFFVKRETENQIDESLGSKGSRRFSASVPPKKIYKDCVNEILIQRGKSGSELDDILKFIYERIEPLLTNDEDESFAHSLLNRFMKLDKEINIYGSEFCKSFCLIPFGNSETKVDENLRILQNVRQQLSNPKSRKKFEDDHKNFNGELWERFCNFLDPYYFRIPGEAEKTSYFQFFDKWPPEIDLPFIEMNNSGDRPIRLNTYAKTVDGIEFPSIPKTNIYLLWGEILKLEWEINPTDIKPNPMGVIIFQSPTDINLNLDSSHDLPLNSVGFGSQPTIEIALKPNQNLVISDESNEKINCLKIHETQAQVILVIENQDVCLLPFHNDDEIVIPCDKTCSLEAHAYSGTKPIPNKPVITRDGEIEKTIKLGSGEKAKLIIRGPDKLEGNVTLVGEESNEPEGSKSVNSLIGAYCDAKQDDIFKGTRPLELSGVIRGSQITITCPEHTEWQKNYQCNQNILFRFLEAFINNPNNIQPRAASVVEQSPEFSQGPDSYDGASWYPGDTSFSSDNFLDSRKNLFNKISSESIPFSFCKLTKMEPEILRYVSEYQKLIDKALSEERYHEKYFKLSLLDTVLILEKDDVSLYQNKKLPDHVLRNRAYLLLPTHPLKLRWLLEREKLIDSIIKDSDKIFANIAIDIINGAGFPELMALPGETVLRHMNSLADGFFSLFLNETIRDEKSIAILDRAEELLGSGSSGSNESPFLPSSERIEMCLNYVHRFIPYRNNLKVVFQKAGTGKNIYDACKSIPKQNNPDFSSLHDYLYNNKNIGLEIVLENNNDRKTGQAFQKNESKERKNLPDNLKVAIPYGNIKEDSGFDMYFEDADISHDYNQNLTLDKCPSNNPLLNLVSPNIQRYDENNGRIEKTIIGRAFTDRSRSDDYLKLCETYQTLFKDPRNEQAFDDKSVRGESFLHNQEYRDHIKKHQKNSQFLLSPDHGAGLGFFDGLARDGENVIIDFDHHFQNPVSNTNYFGKKRSQENQYSHNFIISTNKTHIIESIVRDGLITVLGNQDPGEELLTKAINQIVNALNGISGRYLREVLQRERDIKEAISCGLTSLFYEYLTANNPDYQELDGDWSAVLIPLDDHWSRIHELALSNHLCPKLGNKKSDFLHIFLHENESGLLNIYPQVIEVKYRQNGIVPKNSKVQIKENWLALCHWLGITPLPLEKGNDYRESGLCKFSFDPSICREELAFRVADFAAVLDLYIQRTAVFFPGSFSRSLQDNSVKRVNFQNKIISKLNLLECKFIFPMKEPDLAYFENLAKGEEIIAGNIMVWGPFDSRDYEKSVGKNPRINVIKMGGKSILDFLKNF